MKNGIDVSQWQGKIDWSKVTAEFVIIRAGYGRVITQKDAYFEANYSGCKSRSIPCGAYWFSYALTPEEAQTEAEVFLEVIKGKQFEYPVYLDLEDERQLALGKAACSAIASAFLEKVEAAGYFVGIYSAKDNLEGYISEEIRQRYTVWVAEYGVSKPNYSGAYGIWQKSGSGTAAGISGDVCLDVGYEDFPEIIKSAGLNGFPKTPEPKPEQKKYFEITFDNTTYAGELTEKK